MKSLSSKEIREIFLTFFKKNDHQLIEGSSLIPKIDPTLLFINSGMAPMKKYFLGLETPPYPRLTNIQQCVRTNDIEDVGDRHHLTFFEMMGSWSIGDYYKEKAISLAYDLLVNHFKFPVEKLYATVYKGNEKLNIPPDSESIRCWEKVGFASDHIVPLGEDNFWGPAGDTGPCGPCTEVFFDTGDEYGIKYIPGGHFDDANRYIEIWNAGVFMELNKNKDNSFSPLPVKSVDTGSGVERMFLAINKCNSLYDVDTILPVFNKVKSILGASNVSERELRVVTDHIRTAIMLLSAGVIPDKDGKGYIARRLIRKSIAILLRADKDPSLLKDVAKEVISQMHLWYPDLSKNKDSILGTLNREAEDFDPVFRLGLNMLNEKAPSLINNNLPGDFIFELVATHGVPFEIITDWAAKKAISVDEKGFIEKYREHQEVSRAGLKGKTKSADSNNTDFELSEKIKNLDKTVFTGYEQTNCEAVILEIIVDNVLTNSANAGQNCKIIFDKTPFYAEAGGQVGDSGRASNASCEIQITDTQKTNGIFFHSAIITNGSIKKGDLLWLNIDETRRLDVEKNHTATHLLHASLRNILGSHVTQKGSLVNEHKLRFDFSHPKALTDKEVKEVEFKINNWIWNNYSADIKEMNYQEAVDTGAMALFNENYGDKVRVVNFGSVSIELCGGTHVKSTNEIATLLITQESSAAKGIRRIEAITGSNAYKQVVKSRDLLKSVTTLLACTPEGLIESITKAKGGKTKTENNSLRVQSSEIFTKEEIMKLPSGIKVFKGQSVQDIAAVQGIVGQKIIDQICQIASVIVIQEDALKLLVMISDELQKEFKADVIIKKWLQPFDGKGGGKPSLAKGGINDVSRVEDVFMYINKLF